MAQQLIALGSNVGDRLAHLRRAVELLGEKVEIVRASAIYQTEPMYVLDQRAFFNGALLVRTDVGPLELLTILKDLEHEMGRESRSANGPREIDLDLIAYGRLAYRFWKGKELRLTVPHPRLSERRFVLQPVCDVAPDYLFPGIGVARILLDQTESQAKSVKRLEHALLPVQRLR